MNVYNLTDNNSIFNNFLAELRNVEVQSDRMRFRRNMERIGEIFAYEISKHISYKTKNITTPLGTKECSLMQNNIVVASILRAGIPFHNGLLNYFDKADNAFVGSYRKYHKDNSFEIKSGYLSSPALDNRYLVLADPMLATGSSMLLAYKDLCNDNIPIHTHIVAMIAARDGVEYLKSNLQDKNVTLWVGDIDDELTAKNYIIPGLGDAGDLAFGKKTQE